MYCCCLVPTDDDDDWTDLGRVRPYRRRLTGSRMAPRLLLLTNKHFGIWPRRNCVESWCEQSPVHSKYQHELPGGECAIQECCPPPTWKDRRAIIHNKSILLALLGVKVINWSGRKAWIMILERCNCTNLQHLKSIICWKCVIIHSTTKNKLKSVVTVILPEINDRC